MAVPSSGQLRLRGDIALEVDGSATGSNVSLRALSASAGFSTPDSMSEFYGYSSQTVPSVTTNSISPVGETTVTLRGNVTSDGGATITERGFYFGTNGSSPTNNTKYIVSGTTGSYTNNRTGLSTTTTYYCWAYAKNVVGTTYGARVQATTLAPFVPNYAVSNPQERAGYYTNMRASDVYGGSIYANYNLQYLNPNTGSYVNYETLNNVEVYGYGTTELLQKSFGGTYRFGYNLCTNATNRMYRTFTANYTSAGGIMQLDTNWTNIGTGRSYSNGSNSTNIPGASLLIDTTGSLVSYIRFDNPPNPNGKYAITQFNFS